MIFERSLQRELAYTAGAVFMVLLTIMLTTMMIRIVGYAASGEIDPRDVLVLIGLTVIGYLAVMLVVTLFVSILFVLTRWYRDSEMVVWLASGVSLTRLIKPIGVFATPIVLLIAFFAFVGWPWSNQQSKMIKARFQQRDEISLLAKMAAVCDVYDAITSRRPYRPAAAPADSLATMFGWDGQFDEKVLAAFVRSLGIYPVGSLVRLKSNRLALVIDQSENDSLRPLVRVFYCVGTRRRVPACDLDLSAGDEGDAIVSREDPVKWGFTNWESQWTNVIRAGPAATAAAA